MFLIELDYPSEAEEIQVARTTTGGPPPKLDHLLTPADILRYQALVRRMPVPDHIYTLRHPPRAQDSPQTAARRPPGSSRWCRGGPAREPCST